MTWFDRLLGRIPCLRQRVLVSRVDGETAIEGVLFAQRGRWLVLKGARIKVGRHEPMPLDGDVVIECAQVAFVQVLGS